MRGNNSMLLNGATMEKVVQHYFDTVLFAKDQSPKVVGVTREGNTGTDQFKIAIAERTDDKPTP